MADLSDIGRGVARANADIRLGPTGDARQTGAGSLRFPATGAWTSGTYYTIVADAAFYMRCGTVAVNATTADTGPFPAGVHDFTIPDACTHVAVIAASGTLIATIWKS